MMGLDLEDANADPAALKMTASPQIIIQLKKFAAAVRRQRIEAATAPAAPPPAAPRPPNNTGAEQARTWRSGLDDDLSDILQTENSQGIDASIGGALLHTDVSLQSTSPPTHVPQPSCGVWCCCCWPAWDWELRSFTWD